MNVRSIVKENPPEELPSPPRSSDHADHILRTGLLGHPRLAADHLLHKEMRGKLTETVGNLTRRLTLEFRRNEPLPEDPDEVREKKVLTRNRAYETLIEMAINMIGVEGIRAGFSDKGRSQIFKNIVGVLEFWEELERESKTEVSVAEATVEGLISDMKRIQGGKSMVAKMGEEIEKSLEEGRTAASFLLAAKKAIEENVYFKMTLKRMCKFGNDYAVGLRWVRHLGYVQVSTNPTLAAKAFDDYPELWKDFKELIRKHPDWIRSPEDHADEIAMEGTIVALVDNLRVFAPIALLSDYQHGMISYQLNPNISGSLDESLSDALRVYARIRELLRTYYEYLTWGYSIPGEAGRPDVVFKVSGHTPAAPDITRALTSLGIGTNDTVVYSVGQEALLITEKFEGLAQALKGGIPITQTYETNMGGRLERHLRDVLAEKILSEALEEFEDKEKVVEELAKELRATKDIEDALLSLGEKARRVTTSSSYRANLKFLTQDAFVDVITKSRKKGRTREETLEYLRGLERIIRKAGTYVARRVYQLFFSPENRVKWVKFLMEKHGLTQEQAKDIIRKVDVLPASKRRPDDTFLTLGERNLTNTEFPNHQLSVLEVSREEGFDLSEYENSVLDEPEPEILDELMKMEDFRKAYELTPEIKARLNKVGVDTKGMDEGGLRPEEWPKFGPAAKTMRGFTRDYNEFRRRTVAVVRKITEGMTEN